MTSRERFARMYAHREADRIPVFDSPWGSTLDRWRREGMPAHADWIDYFGLDHVALVWADNSPRYPHRVLEETDAYVVSTSDWGVTSRQWKGRASVPEFLAFTITGPDAWRETKTRLIPAADRIDWTRLKREYPIWRARGDWIEAQFWFGFDVTHSWMVGTERVLEAIAEDPGWLREMFDAQLDLDLALFQAVLDAGYELDAISWPDDMGYKHHQFFSVATYRALLKPVHRRAVEWAHARGLKVRLHSCGDVNPFVPELLEIGVDALNPLEVKAGMDPVALKARWGDRLVLHGGINAVHWDHPAAIEAEIRRTLPALKAGGGYIFASDHSIPDSVGLEDFRRIIALVKELGRFG